MSKKIEPTKMTIAASYTLYKTLTSLIYDTTEGNSQERTGINFSIKFKIMRNRDLLEKDVIFFEQERAKLVREFGEQTPEGLFKVKPENITEFNEELSKLLKIEVEHSLLKLKPEDLDAFDEVEDDIPAENIDLFVAAMVEDPDFVEDLKQPINKGDDTKSEENTVEKQESEINN